MVALKFPSRVIGHRGASAYAPENTMASFARAAQLGCKWVEFDVMLAQCGTPIVFHDETLDRTTNGHGVVDHYPYTYLHGLDAGSWFSTAFTEERIPTLEQVLIFLKDQHMQANVEIKPMPGVDQATVVESLKVVDAIFSQPNDHILFSSFSFPALRYLRAQMPTCQIGLLLHEWEPNWQRVCNELSCVSVHVNEEILTVDKAREIKDMDKQLLCYTVNDSTRAHELFSWGVDAVFSDCPDKIV
jgi:glycerophosphoryl diester phosphodiesterase